MLILLISKYWENRLDKISTLALVLLYISVFFNEVYLFASYHYTLNNLKFIDVALAIIQPSVIAIAILVLFNFIF